MTTRRLATLASFALWVVVVWMAAGTEGLASQSSSTAARAAPPSQIDKGRLAVNQVCVTCHIGLNRMLEVRKKSADEWKDTIYRMIGRGAQVYPDEIEAITAYLTAGVGQGRPQGGRAAANEGAAAADEATAILARRCQQCHDLERARTKSAAGDWNTIVDRMITLGAAVTPAERHALIEYLTGREK
jgi:cytochrome c2